MTSSPGVIPNVLSVSSSWSEVLRAVTFSSAINAWSLYLACKRLGIELCTIDQRPTLPIPVCLDIDASSQGTRLFFTEEASLGRYLGQSGAKRFYPVRLPSEFLDDKRVFADWLVSFGEKPVPYSPALDTPFPFPLLVKARHSWMKGVKLPRGWVCKDEKELTEAKSRITREGLDASWFFFQRWFGDQSVEVLSVCGFFDATKPQRNSLCVVTRVAGYEAGPSCSAVVAVVDDPAGLRGRTAIILNQLQYAGPFELEFLRVGDEYFVLELNPRFWMQHGLFVHAGNGLVKRYLDLDGPEDWAVKPPEKLLWIDGMWFLQRLVKLDVRFMRLIWRWIIEEGYQPVFFPSLERAMSRLARVLVSKIKLMLTRSR